MPRRGRAAGRKRQLRWSKKALLRRRTFDPTIFDRNCHGPTPDKGDLLQAPGSPDFRALKLSRSLEGAAKSTPRAVTQLPAPSIATVPRRLPTKPWPVLSQVKKRDGESQRSITKIGSKSRIRSVLPVKLTIRKEGNKFIVSGNTRKVAPLK